MFQTLFDLFPNETLLRIVIVRIRIDELSNVFLRFAQIRQRIGHRPIARVQNHRPREIVRDAQTIETVVRLLPTQMKDRKGPSTFDPATTKVIGDVQFQSQSKLRIDRINVKVRPMIDRQHQVRDAEDFHSDLHEIPTLFRTEQRCDQDVNHLEEMGTSTNHVNRKDADNH